MGEVLPDGSIGGYASYCHICKSEISTNMQGTEIGRHKCKKMPCSYCGEDLSKENNGVVINKGHSTESYLCDDCHLSEFGHRIMTDLLVFR